MSIFRSNSVHWMHVENGFSTKLNLLCKWVEIGNSYYVLLLNDMKCHASEHTESVSEVDK